MHVLLHNACKINLNFQIFAKWLEMVGEIGKGFSKKIQK